MNKRFFINIWSLALLLPFEANLALAEPLVELR